MHFIHMPREKKKKKEKDIDNFKKGKKQREFSLAVLDSKFQNSNGGIFLLLIKIEMSWDGTILHNYKKIERRSIR